MELKNGKVNGDTVTFLEMLTFRGEALQIQYTGKIVSNDEIKFTRKITDDIVETIVAKRKK